MQSTSIPPLGEVRSGSVYQARTLRWMDVVDDINVHAQRMMHVKQPIPQGGAFKLYPNPNNGMMILEYMVKEGVSGVFSIYDVSGRMVKQQNLNSGTNKVEIDASNLNAGAYYYTVKVNGDRMKAEKLIIVR